ncbi:hypothetical protein GOBAR_DD13508 [Gossypium barbadense]|nr:hypothetical protein GOBAR_DD13508 [Gossypium barbadense]
MELVDDEDMETMVNLYCRNGSEKNAPIHLFVELVGMEQNEDVNASDEEDGAEELWMVAPISYVDSESTMGGIDINLNITPDVDMVGGEEEDPDTAYVAEFLEYPEIVYSYGLAVTSDDDELFIRQRFSCKEECVYAIKRLRVYSDNICWGVLKGSGRLQLVAYELEPHIFWQRMIQLESDMEGQTNTSFRQWLSTMESWQWAQSFDEGFRYGHMTTNLVEGINVVLLKTRHLPIVSVFSATFYRLATLMPRMGQQQVDQIQAEHVFVEHVRDAMVVNRRLARSYGVDLRNRRCECRKFETLHYPCAHVVSACAKVNLDAEQYVHDVYTLERTLRVWENEFPVLPDLSTKGPVARSPPTNLNHHESHNAADTCLTGPPCRTAVGRIQTIQTRRHIRPLRSSDNIHRPPNPDDIHVNPHLIVIVWDLAGGPARALPVAENNMPSENNIPNLLNVGSHNHLRNSAQSIVPQCDKFAVLNSPVQLNSSSLCQAVIIPQLAQQIRDRLDVAKLPKHPIAVILLDDVEIYNLCVSTPYVGINEYGRGYNICNFRPPLTPSRACCSILSRYIGTSHDFPMPGRVVQLQKIA